VSVRLSQLPSYDFMHVAHRHPPCPVYQNLHSRRVPAAPSSPFLQARSVTATSVSSLPGWWTRLQVCPTALDDGVVEGIYRCAQLAFRDRREAGIHSTAIISLSRRTINELRVKFGEEPRQGTRCSCREEYPREARYLTSEHHSSTLDLPGRLGISVSVLRRRPASEKSDLEVQFLC
jgi:hypothetical protein